MRRKFLIISAMIIFLIAAYLLLTTSSILSIYILEKPGLPIGTVITWLGIVSIHILVFFGSRKLDRTSLISRRLIKPGLPVLFLLAILWIPIGFILSGNLAFNFRGQTFLGTNIESSEVFWFNNYFVVAAPIFLLLLQLISTLAGRMKLKRN